MFFQADADLIFFLTETHPLSEVYMTSGGIKHNKEDFKEPPVRAICLKNVDPAVKMPISGTFRLTGGLVKRRKLLLNRRGIYNEVFYQNAKLGLCFIFRFGARGIDDRDHAIADLRRVLCQIEGGD